MALAQEADVLLLDEPTSHLDPAHQVATLALAGRLSRSRGLAVAAVLHDLNLAASADRVVVLEAGRVVRDAAPLAALDDVLVREVFGPDLSVLRIDGRIAIVPGTAPTPTR
jgi:iron complex transport system ATP-binding protein